MKNSILLMTIMLASCLAAIGQEKPKIVVNAKGEMVMTPQMEEAIRRGREMLNNPDFLQMQLVSANAETRKTGQSSVERYRTESRISFELLVTNRLTEPFEITVNGGENRPQLLKDGQKVAYHKRAAQRIHLEDEVGITSYVSVLSLRLPPNQSKSIGFINLSDWYDPLEPGTYELAIRHRFESGGKWIDLPAITFEILPK